MPELMAVKRPSISTSKQSPNESKTILNSFGTQPKVVLTPETPVNEGPPTGQHSIAFFNLRQQNMANDMSANIIRNSLHEVIKTEPKPKEDQISNEHQLPQSSSTQDSPQQTTDQHNSDQSESNSTVSSNIDFNFDAYAYESDSSGNEFPMTALQPTTVQIPTKASAAGLSLNIPTDRISFSEESDEGVTRL